jgi:hypothetical protein
LPCQDCNSSIYASYSSWNGIYPQPCLTMVGIGRSHELFDQAGL